MSMRSIDWWGRGIKGTQYVMPPTVKLPLYPFIVGIISGLLLGLVI